MSNVTSSDGCVNILCYDCQAVRISLMTSYLTITFLPVQLDEDIEIHTIDITDKCLRGLSSCFCPWPTNDRAGVCKKKLICRESWLALGGGGNLIKSLLQERRYSCDGLDPGPASWDPTSHNANVMIPPSSLLLLLLLLLTPCKMREE